MRSPAAPRLTVIAVLVVLAALQPNPLGAQGARRLGLIPTAAEVEVGTTIQLGVTRPGAARGVPPAVRWASLDTSKARVSAMGLVLARDTGAVTITVTSGAARAAARLVIVPAVLVGAGDIGECDLPGARLTAELLDRIPGTVFTTGDNAYPSGSAQQFAACYDPFWGRHRSRTRPAPGNHDFRTDDAAAYFDYFGAAAGERGRGWYAYDLGGWRIYALNSEVGAGPGSAQERWLSADLAMHRRRCVLAYWHSARFSSGPHGSSARTATLFRVLHEAGADVVVTGHDHTYERFAPLAPDGSPDAGRGVRVFVVGTGGGHLYAFGAAERGSEFRYNAGWGVLKLSLVPRGYAWEFVAGDGGRVIDRGAGECR